MEVLLHLLAVAGFLRLQPGTCHDSSQVCMLSIIFD
jgi:hypothetical protein